MLQHIIGIAKIHLKYFKHNWWFLLFTTTSVLPALLGLMILIEGYNMSAPVVASLLPLVMLAGAFPLMVLVWDMISDIKESNTFLLLRRLGMNESALWITTFLFMVPMIAISGFGGTYLLYHFFGDEIYLQRIDREVILYMQLSLCAAMVGVGALFSTTISSKNVMGFAYLAYLGYSILLTFGHIQPIGFPAYINDATYVTFYKVIYAAFFPGQLYGRAWGHILTFILPNAYNALRPVNFNLTMWQQNPFVVFERQQRQFEPSQAVFLNILKNEPTVYDSLFLMWIMIPVYIIFTWYLNQTRFGGTEYPLPYTFLFQSSYWMDKVEHDPTSIIVSDLSKKYAGAQKKSLDEVNLEFTKGNTYVVLGQNGAGKSTLIGVLTGLSRVTTGTGSILGYSISQNNARARSKMGICSQEELFIPYMTAYELVQLYCHFKGVDVSKHGGMRAYAKKMLEKVNLHPHIDQYVTEYSGGMQRRMSLILACIGENRVFFFDEPTAGLDPLSRDQVWKLIEEVKQDNIVFLTTHDMDEADHLSDKGFLD
jgi:ABC-type nitrate/sulfonate/bicarbonate transport system ATPase subunit